MKRLRLGLLLLVAVALCLSARSALAQADHNPDAQQTEQPQTIKPEAKPEGLAAPTNETKHGPENREKHEERCEYRGPDWFAGFYCFFALNDKFWVAFGTLILAVGTGVLGFATVFLWRATRDLVRDAKVTGAEQLKATLAQAKAAGDANIAATQALQQSQRPWVIVDSMEFVSQKASINYHGGGYEFNINVNLKNTGNSVATDVFTVMRLEQNLAVTLEKNWKKTDDDLVYKKEYIVKPTKWPLGIVLAPGQATAQPFGFGGPTAEAGSPPTDKMQAGAYYLMGLVEYKDQFGINHITRFCFNPDPWGSGRLVVSGGMQEAN